MEKTTMCNLLKKALAIILCVAACFAATPVSSLHAEESGEITAAPAISVTSTTVEAGNYAYFNVNATDFVNVAGLEYTLYYDADVMSVNWCNAGYFVSDASTSINTDTAGVIKCSVLNIDGINGSGELLSIGFSTNTDAEPGNYPVTLTVGSVYDTGLTAVTVEKTSGSLTIQESLNDATQISFYDSVDNSWVSKDDMVTYRLYGGTTEGLAAGNFVFSYDETLLELTDVSIGAELQTATSIYSINDENPGYVKISYADIEAISENSWVEYFVLTFKVIKDIDVSTTIDFAADSLVDETLGNLRTNNLSSWIYIEPAPVVNPVFKLVDNADHSEDDSFTVDVVLGENANVAAGDFAIQYDSTQVVCTAVEVDAAVKTSNGLLIYKEDIGNGTVKFSYATTSPFSTEQTLVTLTFQVINGHSGWTYMYTSGKNVVDADYNEIALDYPEFTYTIPVDINNYWGYLYTTNYVYDGSPKAPVVYIDSLTENIDYTVTYADNVNAGTAKAIVTGKGAYKGTKTFDFYIEAANLSDKEADAVLSQSTFSYIGSAIEPEVEILGLEEGKDYTVTYDNNVNVGTAALTISGMGNYTGMITKEFQITAVGFAGKEVVLSQTTYTYDGSAKEPAVTITGLTQGTDYSVSYSNNVNAGTATVTITGKGNYTGTLTKEFQITATVLAGKEAVLSQTTYTYDGSEKEPTVTISGLKQGTDYTASYSNNINVGTATVTITGKGNYTGTLTKEFQITAAGLAGKEAVLSQTTYTYDGTAKEPSVSITDLKQGTDYTVSYSNNVNAGVATVTITGKGNYTGTITKEFQITATGLAGKEAVLSQTTYTYDGTAKEPSVSITGLKQGTDYTVSYSNNINAGTATVTITGEGNFAGTITKEFQITAIGLAGKEAVLSQTTYIFDGSEKEPTVSITGLKLGTDYTVSYSNNVNVGTATVTITGKGNYTGTLTKEFQITAAGLTGKEVALSQAAYTYDGTSKEPTVTITGLKLGTDYSVSYSNNVNVGTAIVTITGKGNYEGTLTKEFQITAAGLAGKEAVLSQTTYTYDGTAKEPTVTISGLEQGTDYTVSYSNNVNAGTATVTITGKGNYAGAITKEFQITAIDIEGKDAVLSETTYIYDGKAKEPEVTIDGLAIDVDFSVSYSNNVEVGKATVTITGIGNYTGVITKEFTIEKPPYILGDVNEDGKISLIDVILMRKYIVNNETVINVFASDMNGDGRTSLVDVILLRRAIANK